LTRQACWRAARSTRFAYPEWAERPIAVVVSVSFIPSPGMAPAIRDRLSGRQPVSFHPLDVVVLKTDQPARGLKRGDVGAIVDIYSPDAIEVEFVAESGRTRASSISDRTTSVRSATTISQPCARQVLRQRYAMPNTNWSRRRAERDAPRLSCVSRIQGRLGWDGTRKIVTQQQRDHSLRTL
jgi:hypothetical protein